ncbi:MAG: hypothetical protein A2328_10140, partial [Bdellovibrionales bacterium RIFOXYB2_FULL_36_6]
MSTDQIKKLEEQIIQHRAYYYQGRPIISDSEYDFLEEKLKELDPGNLVLNLVGSISKDEDKVKHDAKMLSLEKTYDSQDLIKWLADKPVVSTYKIDGVSCSLIYKNGELVLAKTRGDGVYGENVTPKVLWMDSIIKKIKTIHEKVEIRGELYCQEKNFFELANEMEKIGLEKPTSPRNIVAGLISRKDNLELCRYISFMAFDFVGQTASIKLEIEKYSLLKNMGFNIPLVVLHNDNQHLNEIIEDAKKFMMEGDYQIDGLVFTYNDLSLHEELGFTHHHPKFKMAFKFKGESKITKLVDIEWSVSRNGILTPVGLVDPVELSGAKITRVTLHNYGVVKLYNLKKGDEIEIIRSGEVIPKFLSVKQASENKLVIPNKCPECGSDTRIEDIRLICTNSECKARLHEQILNFIKKIGIEDLSGKRLEQLLSKGLIKNIPDLYRITADDLKKMDKTKEKLSDKLFSTIQVSKKADLITFLSALGITHGAYNTCEKVVHAGYDTLDKLFSLSVEELSRVDTFAEKSSRDFIVSLKEKESLINELVSVGFNFQEVSKENKILTGKQICITGALTEKRAVVEQKIRTMGGVVTSSISKD